MNLIPKNEARPGEDNLLEWRELKLLLGAEILGSEDPRSRGDHTDKKVAREKVWNISS